MSHFTVLVVTKDGSQESLDKALAPFHEFECTGLDDEHVVEIHMTEEAKKKYESHSNKGDVTCAEWISGWYGWEVVPFGEQPDKSGKHKYGFVEVDVQGNVVRAVQRTNPNAKWDWWVVGGRWSNRLLTKTGELCDSCKKSDLDIETLKKQSISVAQNRWDELHDRLTSKGLPHTWESWDEVRERVTDIDGARKSYAEQPVISMLTGLERFNFDDELRLPREEYIAIHALDKIQFFAFLKDGNWQQRGEMGWWGCVSNEDSQFNKSWPDLWDSISDDEFVTVVDCHI